MTAKVTSSTNAKCKEHYAVQSSYLLSLLKVQYS